MSEHPHGRPFGTSPLSKEGMRRLKYVQKNRGKVIVDPNSDAKLATDSTVLALMKAPADGSQDNNLLVKLGFGSRSGRG